MKKIKNYIDTELAKKKIARYKYWSIKDETGITITSSIDAEDSSFTIILDKIIADNVDAEVQVKFGTNEASSRQNAPLFIRINDAIEWVEPEIDDTIKINGIPHQVDKNGNVNINLTTPNFEQSTVEVDSSTTFRQEMEIQLEGLRKENELQKVHFNAEIHNKLLEQNIKFKEMMLTERENRITERERSLNQQEAILQEKQQEISQEVKSYLKHVPNALGGLIKDFLKSPIKKESLGNTKKPVKKRNKVAFEFDEPIDQDFIEQEDFSASEIDIETQNQETEQTTNTLKDEELQS